MSDGALKVTVYFGEGERHAGVLVSDGLADLAADRALRLSVLLRGAEGFGLKQVVRTQRLLTMSENAPLVWTAADRADRVEAALEDVRGLLREGGLVTLERVRLASGAGPRPGGEGSSQVTVYPGRRERLAGRPAGPAIVEVLRECGMEGASVLVGLDGTIDGERRRARFFSRNAGVPAVVVAAGAHPAAARALDRLAALDAGMPVTLERAHVLKRDGMAINPPRTVPDLDPAGLGWWQKVTVHSRQGDRSGGRPLHLELVRRLRRAGASGATVLRGTWGYRGDERPHGDGAVALGRRGPVLTVLVGRPAEVRGWWPIVDEVTARGGMVTGEIVPAFQAVAPGAVVGGLRLAGGRAPKREP